MIRSAVGMRNLRVAAIFVLALLIGAQLTLHNHSLIPEAGSAPPLVCAVCAFGADRITLDAPLLILLGFLVAAATAPVASPVRVTSRGRAPPARF